MRAIVGLIVQGSLLSRLATRQEPRSTATGLGTLGRGTFCVSYALGRFAKLCGAELPSRLWGLRVSAPWLYCPCLSNSAGLCRNCRTISITASTAIEFSR